MDKFYTIPTRDISGDTFRQTVVDREAGLYIGHPTTALLEDGRTIVIVYPKNHGNGQVVLKKSYDGGATWSDRLPVPDSWSTSLEVPTIYRVEGADGAKRLLMFSGMYPIRMAVSEDRARDAASDSHGIGETWTELSPIGDYGGIVAVGDVEQTAPGEYIAMFHDDGRFIHGGDEMITEVWRTGAGADARTKTVYRRKNHETGEFGEPEANWIKTPEKPGDVWKKIYEARSGKIFSDGRFELYQIKSTDGGLTWSEPRVICSHKAGAELCEPCIIRSPDGKTLVTLLRENARKYNSFYIRSDDNGETWSEPKELPAALTGDRHASVYLPDGRLFVSFRDTTRESPTAGDWVAWVGTFDDILSGREGEYRVRIMRNYWRGDCAYPGVLLLPTGEIVTTTYGHFTPDEEAYIVSVRVTPEELDSAPVI